jgi:hypothetical protein
MPAAARGVQQKTPNWTFFGDRKFCFFKIGLVKKDLLDILKLKICI